MSNSKTKETLPRMLASTAVLSIVSFVLLGVILLILLAKESFRNWHNLSWPKSCPASLHANHLSHIQSIQGIVVGVSVLAILACGTMAAKSLADFCKVSRYLYSEQVFVTVSSLSQNQASFQYSHKICEFELQLRHFFSVCGTLALFSSTTLLLHFIRILISLKNIISKYQSQRDYRSCISNNQLDQLKTNAEFLSMLVGMAAVALLCLLVASYPLPNDYRKNHVRKCRFRQWTFTEESEEHILEPYQELVLEVPPPSMEVKHKGVMTDSFLHSEPEIFKRDCGINAAIIEENEGADTEELSGNDVGVGEPNLVQYTGYQFSDRPQLAMRKTRDSLIRNDPGYYYLQSPVCTKNSHSSTKKLEGTQFSPTRKLKYNRTLSSNSPLRVPRNAFAINSGNSNHIECPPDRQRNEIKLFSPFRSYPLFGQG